MPADLTVIVPSRGRPDSVRELAEAFEATCTTNTRIVVAIDSDDPKRNDYGDLQHQARSLPRLSYIVEQPSGTMVSALNLAASAEARHAFAVGFMGDDHRPRTRGWDQAYLDGLRDLGTGIVYGDDLFQRGKLPTQCAMTSDIVRELGYMAPPSLTHLAVDNWWLELGSRARCIRFLPDVVVEHLHPVAGKAVWDEGYRRVNSSEMYSRDLAEFQRIARTSLAGDVAKVRALRGAHV